MDTFSTIFGGKRKLREELLIVVHFNFAESHKLYSYRLIVSHLYLLDEFVSCCSTEAEASREDGATVVYSLISNL